MIKDILIKNQLDALLVSSVSNITYLTNFSSFSKDEREAFLLITKTKQFILTDARYSEAVRKQVKNFKLIEISPTLSFEKALKKIIKKHKIKKLGFEGHNISFMEHKRLLKYFNNIYHLSISSLRKVKTQDEISKIENACKLGDKTFNYIINKIKQGISEKELAAEIEFFIKKNGGDISFRPIVAFGKNSATPHHQISDKRLATSDKLILLDFGVKLNNYCSDMTRTVFFGRPTPEQKRMYETVLEAQSLAIKQFNNLTMRKSKEQIKASKIDETARKYILSKGYPTIPHSLGHGIGIDVHEAPYLSPKSKDILKEGMVFSVEPGIYIPASPAGGQGGPGFGGVRIEDLVVLDKNGPRLLTHSPKKLIEI